jgi:Predicted transcriptional regulators
MAIGNKIKSLLKKKKMKVTTLANLTNIPEQTLYAIIRRDSTNVDLDILRKVCLATEINISYFYNGHTDVESTSNSSDAAEHITFSAIDLPSKEPNEKHFDIATNYVVLSILENMAEEQGCSPSDIIENILTENLKNYATNNEMTLVTEDDDTSDDTDATTRDADLPYWMF